MYPSMHLGRGGMYPNMHLGIGDENREWTERDVNRGCICIIHLGRPQQQEVRILL